MSVQVFDTAKDLSAAVAERIVDLSKSAIAARGRFSVAFSGGSLPVTLADSLPHKKDDIDFSKWLIFFADERCVGLDDKESNFRVCSEAIFRHLPLKPEQIVTINSDLVNEPEKAAEDYENKIRSLLSDEKEQGNGIPKLDLLLLGVGPDGHCCSLFPGHRLMQESKRLVASIIDSPKPPAERITLTFPIINNARNSFFICTGEGKQDIVHQALESNRLLPCSRVSSDRVEWLVDRQAAAKLSSQKNKNKL